MIQDTGSLDMRIVLSERLSGFQVAEVGKSNAPREALADRIETNGAQILIDFGASVRA
jgi:hypothetical protein